MPKILKEKKGDIKEAGRLFTVYRTESYFKEVLINGSVVFSCPKDCTNLCKMEILENNSIYVIDIFFKDYKITISTTKCIEVVEANNFVNKYSDEEMDF